MPLQFQLDITALEVIMSRILVHQVFFEDVPKPENPIMAIMSGSPTWRMQLHTVQRFMDKIILIPSLLVLVLVFASSSDSSCIPFVFPPPPSTPSSAGQNHSLPEMFATVTCHEIISILTFFSSSLALFLANRSFTFEQPVKPIIFHKEPENLI